jgi:alkylresorcinol/alkylpyrone synthase
MIICAFPRHVAVLLSVELRSLTLQRDDNPRSPPHRVSLFADGAAAVVAIGADRVLVGSGAHQGPRILSSRSLPLPATADMMGWDVSSNGLSLCRKDVPKMVDDYLGKDVNRFLAEWFVHR